MANERINVGNAGNIQTLTDLQNVINSLESNNQATRVQQPGAPAANTVSAQEALQRAENLTTINQMRSQVEDFINKRKNRFADVAPVYLKPAFFIDQFTPYLKVEFIYFQRERPDDITSSLIEKTIDVLSDPVNDVNNHVKSFKYTIKGESNDPNIEIALIDINQEILDFMALQFASIERLSNMVNYIKVTYGWYNNKLNAPSNFVDWNNIAFTNTIFGVIADIKVTYTSGGIPEATILAMQDAGFTGALRHLNPYNILGAMPAVTLCIKEFMDIIDDAMNYIKTASTNNKKLALGFLVALMRDKGVIDNGVCLSTLRDITKYYAHKDTAHLVLAGLVQDVVRDNGSAKITDTKFNPIKGPVTNNKGINRMMTLTNAIERDEYDTSPGPKPPSSQEQFDIKMKNMLQSNPSTAAARIEKRDWVKMFRSIGTMIQDNFLVHPYFVWRYVINIFDDKTRENEYNVVTFKLDGIDIDNKKLFPRTQPASTTIAWSDVIWAKNDYIPRTEQDKVYYKRADTYSLQPFQTWAIFLASISGDCQMKYQLTPAAAQLYGVTEQTERVSGNRLVASERTRGGESITFAPMRIHTNFFMCDYKAAKLNLDIYERALNARLAYLKGNNSTNNNAAQQAMRQTAINTVEAAISYVGKRKTKINQDSKYYMFIMRDAMSSEQVFNPEVALNNVVQAYSYNINGVYTRDPNGYFNPGKPNCLHVNFPDVISFQPDLNYRTLMQSLSINTQISGEYEFLNEVINEDTESRRQTLLQSARDAITQAGTGAQGNTNLIDRLKSIAEQIRGLGPTTDPSLEAQRTTERVPINTFDYSQNRIYGGQMDMALSRKRDIQEIRKKLLLTGLPFNAEMAVLGDATYTLRDMGSKHIYLKFTNLDGSMSMFSGIYTIDNVTQEISTGQFKTTFKLMCQRTLNDPQQLSQINAMIYNTDRQSMYPISTGLGDPME